MKCAIFSALLLFAISSVGKPAFSEGNEHFIDVPAIPDKGSSTADFVPKGWAIESTVEDDLNGDSRPDAVLTLIEPLPNSAEKDSGPTRNRALVVLLRSKAGGYKRVAFTKRLLRCSTCYGTMGGTPYVAIIKGVLIVEELWGSRETTKTRFNFRYDNQTNKMLLIGEDIESSDRVTGSIVRTSSNFLTRVKLTESERFDEKLNRMVKSPAKKQRLPRIKRSIEDVNYEQY
jgi:hypothetical protein